LRKASGSSRVPRRFYHLGGGKKRKEADEKRAGQLAHARLRRKMPYGTKRRGKGGLLSKEVSFIIRLGQGKLSTNQKEGEGER